MMNDDPCFFQNIQIQYGVEVRKHLNHYKNISRKISMCKPRNNFLLRCRKFQIFPRFINDKIHHFFSSLFKQNHPYQKNIEEIKQRLRKSILNLEIKICNFELRKLQGQFCTTSQFLENSLPPGVLTTFMDHENENYNISYQRERTRLTEKYDFLVRKQHQPESVIFNESCFINLTEKEFPKNAKIILSFGPKFSVPNKKDDIPTMNLICDIEGAITSFCNEDDGNEVRQNSLIHLHNHTARIKHNRTEKFILEAYDDTQKFLRKNPDIYILNSDKGGGTVAIMKSEYQSKMDDLLSDTSTYLEIDEDPTNSLKEQYRNMINNLFKSKKITFGMKVNLSNNSPVSPRIHGLPKLHKQSIPLRPIVNTIKSVPNNLSKFMCTILKKVTDEEKYYVKNSFEFQKFIKGVRLKNDEILVSFDVKSLFTNLDPELIVKIVHEKWNIIQNYTSITKRVFENLLKFIIIDCNYFSYEEKFYRAKFGVAMGDPLSPILADLVLEKLIDDKIKEFPHQPTFFKKYVDDIITVIPEEDIDTCLDIMNSYHPRLEFTTEKEEDRSIVFLDLRLIHLDDGTINTDWYQKPTSCGRILNYLSSHPKFMIENVGISFASRVLTLSDTCYHSKNKKTIRKILSENNYPKKTINKIIFKSLRNINNNNDNNNNLINNHFQNSNIIQSDNNNTGYSSMTYVPKLTEKIQREFKIKSDNIKFGVKPNKKIFSIFTNTKSKIPNFKKSDLVYEINCTHPNCNQSYIGETSQHLGDRIQQHQNDVDNRHRNTPKTALVEHVLQHEIRDQSSSDVFDFDNSKILVQETNNKKRKLLEAAHIWKNKSAVNIKTDSQNLKKTYFAIIQKCLK
jgi:hypothetical protein